MTDDLTDREDEPWDGRCLAELCTNWTGDGRVCACALLDIQPGRFDA